MRVYTFRSGGPGTVLLAIVILGLGVVFFVVGFALLATLTIVGGVLTAGAAAYRMLTGRKRELPRERQDQLEPLDPRREVFPD